MRRKGGPENAYCKYRGVRQRTWGKWVSEISMPNHGERIWIGTFDDSKAAALAYDEVAIRMFGATAKLNFPDQLPQMSLQVHSTASTSAGAIIDQDAVVNQRLSAANDEHNFLDRILQASCTTDVDPIPDQSLDGKIDIPNFINKLIEMQQGKYPPGDEVSLIDNPIACLINDHVYDYHDQILLHEGQGSVAPTANHDKFEGSNVTEDDKNQKPKNNDNKEKMRAEFSDDSSIEGIETTCFCNSTDLGGNIAGVFEYAGDNDGEEDLGSINIWF